MSKKIILTGLSPTAENLHIGNLIGAIYPLVKMQNDKNNELYLFVSDLHALTNPNLKLNIAQSKKNLIATYIACGIDPSKTILFYQSDVHTHAELGWVMICNSYFGELSRMTQFKDKSLRMKQGNGTDMIPVGLFTYPSLMAADILLYDADIIPVGKDQKQHVEIARNLAERFNKKFGNTFKIPSHYSPKSLESILDLTDTQHKMSKSLPVKGTILLSDSQEEIAKKIKGALTDNLNKIKYDTTNQPSISNLITIYSILGDISIEAIEKKYSNIKNYGEFKNDLTKVVQKFVANFQSKYKNAMVNIDKYLKIVDLNAKKCLKKTEPKLLDVYKKIGLK